MASKDDVIKALKIKYDKKLTELRKTEWSPFPKQKELEKIDKATSKNGKEGNAFSEIRKIGGYDVKVSCSWYSVSTEIVDPQYLKLKKEKEEFEKKRTETRDKVDAKYNEIMEKVLLFGVSDDLVKLIEAF